MEIVKRTVDELNQLAQKMTGTNPKAKTDAQALNFIEQNYTGGGITDYLLKVVELEASGNTMIIKCTANEVESWIDQNNKLLMFGIFNDNNGNISSFPININFDLSGTRRALLMNEISFYPINDDKNSYFSATQ